MSPIRTSIHLLLALLAFSALPGCALFLLGGTAVGVGVALQDDEETPAPAPTITLTSPGGSEIWGGTHAVRWNTAAAVEKGSVRIEVSDDGGATWTTLALGATDTGSWDWDTSLQADGIAHRVRVRATDVRGVHSAWDESPADFTLDNTAPVTILLGPMGGELWQATKNVSWTTADAHATTVDVELSSDSGGSWAALALSLPDAGIYIWDTTLHPDGAAYRVRVRASDLSGNVGAWSGSPADVELDNTAPTVALTSPLGSELWNGARAVTWTTTDANPSTVVLQISSDSGGAWSTLASILDAGTFTWNTAGAADGATYRIRAVATDLSGNVSPWSASPADFELDNTAPSVALTSPAGGELWTGSWTITWNSVDLNPGTVDIEVSGNSGSTWSALATAVADSGAHAWNTALHTDGAGYMIRLRASDALGNVSAWSASASEMGLDNIAPVVVLTAPTGGEAWWGTHDITWTTTDVFPGTVDIDLSIDSGATWSPLATGVADTGTYSWDSSSLANDSRFRIRVTAYDQASHVSPTVGSLSDFCIIHYLLTRTFSGTSSEYGYDVASDGTGNLYLSGSFFATVDFQADWGTGTDSKISVATTDLYVTRVNADGTYGWTRIAGGVGNQQARGLAVDPSDNVYVSGVFENTVDFQQDWGTGTDSKSSLGSYDSFVMKINANGSYGWTRRIGGTGVDWAWDIATDGNGNVYVVGRFNASVDFRADWGAPTDILTPLGSYDVFVTRINADGSYGWTRRVGGTGDDSADGVSVDGSGNIFVAGYFQGTVDFRQGWGAGSDSKTSAGLRDVFALRINADGSYGWTRRFGGTGEDRGNAIVADGSGRVYVTGRFETIVNFEADWSGSDSRTVGGQYDVFVTQVGADGSYGWARAWGSSFLDEGRGIACDGSDNVYVTGFFCSTTLNFAADWGGSDTRPSAGSTDIFVLRIHSDGSYGWTRRMGGSDGDTPNGIAVDGNGKVTVTGYFKTTVDFQADFGGGTDFKNLLGNSDAFFTRLR